jgi:S-DNA-T family DNA segregation ATPase FtsK/SpoIIIE
MDAVLDVVRQVQALPASQQPEGLAIARAWAAAQGVAEEFEQRFRPLNPIEQMLIGIEEISRQFGFELIAVEGFEAPRVNVLRFKPAEKTDVTRIRTKFENVIARVPGIPASPEPVIRIDNGAIEILVGREIWSCCHLNEYITSEAWDSASPLTITWGVAIEGKPFRLPLIHALIAGTTGGGKTSVLNALLGEFAIRYKPWEVQWLLIDIERVGLCQFNGLPYFWRGMDHELPSASIVDPVKAYDALSLLLKEHERRLDILASASVDTIGRYNQRNRATALPHIVAVIDEYAVFRGRLGAAIEASLPSPSGKGSERINKEGSILADKLLIEMSQRCRKTGIHLVVATQRASAQVIDPELRDNLSTRIVLQCSSKGGSAVIFGRDCDWATKLAGSGDMWVVNGPIVERCQGLYIDADEPTANGLTRLERLIHATKNHQPYLDWLAKSLPRKRATDPGLDDHSSKLGDQFLEMSDEEQA